ncbi:MAG: outer membrane beta-barrel protein [Ignavibacteriae bacterium]|nr:outer membrane beta-barrel protein [Ignavibacteriota bacterium]
MASIKAPSCLFLLALVLAIGWSMGNAQSLRLGLKGGFLHPVSTESFVSPTESSHYPDVYTSSNGGFGFNHWEPTVGLEVRYSPTPGGLAFAADASYSKLAGTGVMSLRPWDPDPPTRIDISSHLYTISAGAQWSFLSGPVRPYIGARALWTRFRLIGVHESEIPNFGFNYWGLAVLGGATIDLTSLLALDIGARYNFTRIGNHQEDNPWFNTYFNGVCLDVGLFFNLL